MDAMAATGWSGRLIELGDIARFRSVFSSWRAADCNASSINYSAGMSSSSSWTPRRAMARHQETRLLSSFSIGWFHSHSLR
ncbi:hypothetical protein E2562_026514 [Oryza meyeriana var. granulata]|uniref:Uncharacterized protein n=1 Tax=Oryza meyeriana var. granulata TaxID=110450 RepID=A0A6G1DNB5_9ORYZ|nr:hypothetical protein E2562_026514 [Oryza meyeriana var. granulata]